MATFKVTNPADSGPGTLREAIKTMASSGDTIVLAVPTPITLTSPIAIIKT